MQGKLGEVSQIFATHCYLRRMQFILAERRAQAKLQDLGLPTPKNCL